VSPLKAPSLQQLRRYAIARSLFKATSLPRAIARLGFVQADPMRAPARAQDLILAQRVKDYRAGELERRYPRLAIEEAFFVNYGFLPRETLALLHPRGAPRAWDASMLARAQEVLAFVRQRGRTHPKEVQAQFDHGRITRWGADLNASTHLLEGLHYRGLLRVARREAGTRIYQAIEHPPQDDSPEARLARAGQLLDMVVQLYAPLPAASLGYLCGLLRYGVPHLATEARQVQEHAKSRYAHAQVDGLLWFWPQGEKPVAVRHPVDDRLRFLSPFDPVGLGPTALPVVLGLGIQAGGLCAGLQAPYGPLRDAHAMGRANTGLGQSEGGRWPAAARAGLRRPTAARERLSAGAG
jgi:uncharacterized protein